MDAYWVYVTTKDADAARAIAKTVVGERLAACANILGAVESIYWWQGELCEGAEVALVLKTSDRCKESLINRIKALHSYDCPCIVCLPIADGNRDFLDWIANETSPS